MPRQEASSTTSRVRTGGNAVEQLTIVRGPDALRRDRVHVDVIDRFRLANSQNLRDVLASKIIALEWSRRLAGAGGEEYDHDPRADERSEARHAMNREPTPTSGLNASAATIRVGAIDLFVVNAARHLEEDQQWSI